MTCCSLSRAVLLRKEGGVVVARQLPIRRRTLLSVWTRLAVVMCRASFGCFGFCFF